MSDRREETAKYRKNNQVKIRAYYLSPRGRAVRLAYYHRTKLSDPTIAERRRIRQASPEAKAKRNATLLARRKSDPVYRIKEIIRAGIWAAIKGKKKSRTVDLVGCSISELKLYLEKKFLNGMSWDNYGLFGWHIDHIRPCASFDLSDLAQQKQCFHYSNLQPLWWQDNLSKNDTWYPDQKSSPGALG